MHNHNLSLDLICISLMSNDSDDVEFLFKFLFIIWISYFMMWLIIFKFGFFVFSLLICRRILYILHVKPLTYTYNIFPSLWLACSFLNHDFLEQKFLILMKFSLSFLYLLFFQFKKELPTPRSWRYFSMFSSRNLIVLILYLELRSNSN